MIKGIVPLILIAGVSTSALASDLAIIAQQQEQTQTDLYSKYSHAFSTGGEELNNPFNSQEIKVDAVITTPSGATLTVPMFYKDSTGEKTVWGLNFAPQEVGKYQYQVVARHDGEEVQSKSFTFNSLESDAQGFLTNDGNMGSWAFDNGDRFRGVGLNIGWEARITIGDNPDYTYEYWMRQMKKDDINLVRTWVNAPWNIPLEWKKPVYGRYSKNNAPGLHPEGIERFDYLIEHAEKNDVKLILAMDYHGSLWAKDHDNWGNDFWKSNPYNVKNGGPAATPEEFFTHPGAISRYQDRLRYIVARWGYSTNIAAIEFWNEVDNAIYKKDQNISPKAVTEWHQVMSDYLEEIDPYNHIKTTSISHKLPKGLFNVEGLDLIQSHLYGMPAKTSEMKIKQFSKRYKKSYAVGEAALGWEGVNSRIEEYALHLHENLWVAMFNKTPFLPLTWWWEDYDSAEQNFHLKHAANFIDNLTSTDDLFVSTDSVKVEHKLMRRALNNNGTHYIWVKNNKKDDLSDIGITLTNKKGVSIDGEYNLSMYDTWTGKTTSLNKVSASDNKLNFELDSLDAQKDVVLILSK
ncbi:DUF5060 domain-containing protein [Photobacterium sagamiensis]|uniref:DUF5060 domain-containing protein n=1 Tax=Photobacterium sagamiensis TaxID=2910241 RepID=UPI003D136F6B